MLMNFRLLSSANTDVVNVPVARVDYLQPIHKQLSCSHMQRRFSQVKELLQILGQNNRFFNTKPISSSRDFDNSIYDYIMYKMDISRNIEFSLRTLRVYGEFDIDLLPEMIDGWMIKSFSQKEYSPIGRFEHLPGAIEVDSSKVKLRMDLPTGVACLEQKVEFVVLSNCPFDLVNIGTCNIDNCINYKEFNWNKCEFKKRFILDLTKKVPSIGKRKREMRRVR